METASRNVTKFVTPPNSHLICKLCQKLFREPVINVKCGHTFCRDCIFNQSSDLKVAKCCEDDVTCELDALVVNRSVSSQIDDLEIYCTHGVQWSDQDQDYIPDPTGCTQQIKYGSRADHEDQCMFAPVPCPNSALQCGQIRQCHLDSHLRICSFYPCRYKHKGCQFSGMRDEVARHMATCTHSRSPVVLEASLCQVPLEGILQNNKRLRQEVESLTTRVTQLEGDKAAMFKQLNDCIRDLSMVRREQEALGDRVNRVSAISRVPSSPSSGTRSLTGAGVIQRSVSTPPSPSRTTSRDNAWTMPFQFKCIGTLRSHKGGVWALKTHKNVLFSAGGDNFIKVWNLDKLEVGCTNTMKGHTDKIQALTAGQYLYSAGADRSIRAWDLKDFSIIKVTEAAHDDIIAALVCTDNYLFSSSHTVIKVWNPSSLEPMHTMTGLKHWVRCLTLSHSKDILYSGSHNTIDLWEPSGQFLLKGKISHTYGSVHSLTVTSQYIIAGTYNNNTHLFDVVTLKYLRKLSGHVGTVQSVSATLSGRFLFTASTDSTIQLWSLENFLPIQPLSRHDDSVNVVTIHNDLLFSGSEDTEIKVFKYFKMQMGFNPA